VAASACRRSAGIGEACIAEWLQSPTTAHENPGKSGYEMPSIKVDELSGGARSFGETRDASMVLPNVAGPLRSATFGYSKGAPDVLEAVVRYPELGQRIAAAVRMAGAVGGSSLANDARLEAADILKHWSQATCDSGDGAVGSLRPDVRKAWFAQNSGPAGLTTRSSRRRSRAASRTSSRRPAGSSRRSIRAKTAR